MSVLKDALNEALGSEIGQGARVCLWQYLSRYHSITAHDIETLEKMQDALGPLVGNMAKPIANMALSSYMSMRKERRHVKELDQSGMSN